MAAIVELGLHCTKGTSDPGSGRSSLERLRSSRAVGTGWVSLHSNEFGRYLRARRAMVAPQEVGLPVVPRRCVDGRRREEVAEIVGLSTDYYVRLKQACARHPSAEVLNALCRALLLGPAERIHLHNLARAPIQHLAGAAPRNTVRSSLRQTGSCIQDAPAMIMNDRSDALAWNGLATALIADFPNIPPAQRNMAWRILLGPHATKIHPDWNDAARTTVGILRMAVGWRLRDTALTRRRSRSRGPPGTFTRIRMVEKRSVTV